MKEKVGEQRSDIRPVHLLLGKKKYIPYEFLAARFSKKQKRLKGRLR